MNPPINPKAVAAHRGPTLASEGGEDLILFDPHAGKTSAQLCRENGWGKGTVLESESLIRHRLRITAIGESAILAAMIGLRHGDEPWGECSFHHDDAWRLTDRTWKAVAHVPPAEGGPPDSERDPVVAARERLDEFERNSQAGGLGLNFSFPPDLLGVLVVECERLRGENAKLLDALVYVSVEPNDEEKPRWFSLYDYAPGKRSNTGLAEFDGPFATREEAITRVRESWELPTPDNSWPDHPVMPDPDPAEARQVEERAQIEALAREEEARAKEEGRREAFNDAIDRWHDGLGEGKELHKYLGLTWEQYARHLETGEVPEGWEPPAELQGEDEEQ